MPSAGTTAGYRPIPRDFREVFVRVGWSGIEAHYRAHKTTVKRWLREAGEDDLREARRQVTRYGLSPRAKRYVLGRTLRPIAWPCAAPTFFDMGIVADPALSAVEPAKQEP